MIEKNEINMPELEDILNVEEDNELSGFLSELTNKFNSKYKKRIELSIDPIDNGTNKKYTLCLKFENKFSNYTFMKLTSYIDSEYLSIEELGINGGSVFYSTSLKGFKDKMKTFFLKDKMKKSMNYYLKSE